MPLASLRSRAIGLALPVLVAALGLVGLAVDAANERVAVTALRDRMESTVYAVLAAMEVDEDGAFTVVEDFADPRLLQRSLEHGPQGCVVASLLRRDCRRSLVGSLTHIR